MDDRRQCTAKSVRSGERCKKAAILGGTVCATHGGSAPQVRRKAKQNLLELVDPAIQTLRQTMDNPDATDRDKLRAAENVLDRAGYPRTANLDVDDARAELARRLIEIRDGVDEFDDE